MSAKILVIEDEEDVSRLLYFILSREGYEVILADNGKLGLEKVYEDKPNLIFLDIMMPGIDGWQVLRTLKSDSKTSSIPVIMLTALNRISDMERGLQEGAVAYITKPFSPERIKRKVTEVLGASQDKSAQSDQGNIKNLLGKLNPF